MSCVSRAELPHESVMAPLIALLPAPQREPGSHLTVLGCHAGIMDDNEDPMIVEGMAAIALTAFEMGKDAAGAREDLVAMWQDLGRPTNLFQAAAVSISGMPQPLSESPEVIERMRPIRESFGVTSADASLVAALQGRELLEGLAAELG